MGKKIKFVTGIYVAIGAAVIAGCVSAGPSIRAWLTNRNWSMVSNIAADDAGPFTVHFVSAMLYLARSVYTLLCLISSVVVATDIQWAPMSKWLISGASMVDINRATEKISLAQYTALTLTGFFFSRYALLVTPINYMLCAVNLALFVSSGWHLGRKLKADFI